jgi:uncharacterized membrane protein YphA (DoxX/SURF4 family)
MTDTENSTTETPQAATETHRWSLASRVGFRFAFCYFMLYLFCNGNVTVFTPIDRITWVNDVFSGWFNQPFHPVTEWLGQRVFHLTGVAAKWHGGGSGDTAQQWILVGVFVALALVATLVWSVLDRRRTAYPVLYAWLRFTIRLMVGVSMLWYGFDKVFPIQMQPPTLGVLNEPFGQMSPDSLLWSMLGAMPVYEMICGWAEVVAGVLLLIRRTALAGALLTTFIMTNVLLYNMFYDVPVKLFAAHLVLFAVFVVLGDAESLFRFFVLNKPAEPKGVWVPPASRAGILKAMRIAEVCYLVLGFITSANAVNNRWIAFQAGKQPSPLVGAWTVVDAMPLPVKTAEGRAWTNIYFDNTYRAMVRDTSGQLWRYGLKYDAKKATVEMRGPLDLTKFKWSMDDPNHLTLNAVSAGLIAMGDSRVTKEGKEMKVSKALPTPPAETLRLERQPTAKSYVLYDRGFHLVNEWGYEH